MRSGSPKRSSTSSAKPSRRPRYLAVELAPGTHAIAPRSLEAALAQRLASATPEGRPRVRVLRFDGQRSLVEVDHLWVGPARERWNGTLTLPDGRSVGVATRRAYGTMRKGKRWLRASPVRVPESVELSSSQRARGH